MPVSQNSQSLNLAPNDYVWKYLSNHNDPKLQESGYLAYKIHPIKPTGNLIEDLNSFDNYRINRNLEFKKLDLSGSLNEKIERYSWFIHEELKKQGKLALDKSFLFDFYERFFDMYCYYGLDKLAESIVNKNTNFDASVTQALIDTFFLMNLDYEVNNGGFSQFFYNGNMAKYLLVEQAMQRVNLEPYLTIYTNLMAEIRKWSNENLSRFYEEGIFHDNDKYSIQLANKLNEIAGSIPFLKENNYYEIEPKLEVLIIDYMNSCRQEFENFASM